VSPLSSELQIGDAGDYLGEKRAGMRAAPAIPECSDALVAQRRPPQVDQPDEAAGAAVGQQAAERRVELGRGDHLWFVIQQSNASVST